MSCPSARWDESYAFEVRRVAIIGTGASAIQMLPKLATQAASLVVFQRSPPWIVPRRDRALSPPKQRRSARWPALQWLHRAVQYVTAEGRIFGFILLQWLRKLAEAEARGHPALRGARARGLHAREPDRLRHRRAGAARCRARDRLRGAARAHADFMRQVDRRLDRSVRTRCSSWYRGRGGRVSAIWSDFTFRYRAMARRADRRQLLLHQPGGGASA